MEYTNNNEIIKDRIVSHKLEIEWHEEEISEIEGEIDLLEEELEEEEEEEKFEELSEEEKRKIRMQEQAKQCVKLDTFMVVG